MEKLFSDFRAVSSEEWEAKITADLKGKDYRKELIGHTYEGFDVRPFYRREDLKGLEYLCHPPGEFPFVRGNRKKRNEWFIRQDIYVEDPVEANGKALIISEKGVNSMGFILDCSKKITLSDLDILLKDICLETFEINFLCKCLNCSPVLQLKEYLSAAKDKRTKFRGSVAIDPVGAFVLNGKIDENSFNKLKSYVKEMNEFPGFRIIGIHGKIFANCGSSIVQELAFTLAQGTEYLIRLTEGGLDIDEAANSIKFNFGIGNNYFMEIAKLRAARLLWAHIVKAFEPGDENSARLIAHSETNSFNKTLYDPYVNMIRTQTEAMSAVLGCADSVTVQPFNAIYGESNDFSERIARNQQILLKEEAHFDKITDPAAGSYYIENLTASIAEHAWELFLKVQDRGGFLKAFRAGFIQSEIKSVAAKRSLNLALQRESILGINRFPNYGERIQKEYDTTLFEPADQSEEGSEVETLKLYRFSQPIEALRYKTDIYSRGNKRPVVFLLPFGNPVFSKIRAQFSSNFFAVAGFDIIDNNGFETVGQGLAAASDKNSDIVVFCSSDDEYIRIITGGSGLKNDYIPVVAGNPTCRPELEEFGINRFIHMKSNILEELENYQNLLMNRGYETKI